MVELHVDMTTANQERLHMTKLYWTVALTGLLVVFSGCMAKPAPSGRIAFNSYRDGNSEIYVINADGSGLERLTFNEAKDTCPAWSPTFATKPVLR